MYGTEFARISGRYSTAYIGTYGVLSQSTQNNTTTFRLYGYFYYGGGDSVGSDYSTFNLDGQTIKSGSYRYYPGYTLLGTKDITVTHNNDGSFPGRSVGISASSYHMSGSTSGNIYANKIDRQAMLTKANDFNDEQNPYMEFTNPANFKVSLRLEFAGTYISRNGLTGSGGYTFELTDAERKLLRQKCTTNSLTVRYVVATLVDGANESLWSWADKTMTLINANPEFSNFIFEDVNSTTVALTGNNQNIIKGVSTVEVTIPASSKASAKKEATMSKYRFTCGDKAVDIPYSNSEGVSNIIQNIPNGTFTVYATDSRGNSTPVTKLANQVVDYSPLTKISIDAYRSGGVSEEVILQLEGTINVVNFGKKTNTIKTAKVKYRVAKTDKWSNEQDIVLTVVDGKFSYNGVITGDLESKGFNISNSYEVEVVVTDELSSVTFTDTFSSGTPNIAYHKKGISIMGKYDVEVGGLAQVNGNPLAYYPIGSIYMSVNNTDPSTLFGGTWVSWGAGRVPVGVDTSDNDFSTVEKTGGEKKHTLTVNEMPSHYHGLNTVINGTNPGDPAPYRIQTDKYQWGGTGVYTSTDGTGSSQPHNNMQPYITCYMWKRTG